MKQVVVFDCETDGLKPTKIHCLAAHMGGKIFSTTDYDQMRKFLSRDDIILVAHNGIRYDGPALEKVLGIKVVPKIVCSLSISWYLFPDRLRHGLAEWGEDFGVPKPLVEDWEDQPIEVYIHRCKEDVRINKLLWEKQWKFLLKLYGSEEEAWRLIDYLAFKMDCAREQERSRWKLDVKLCKQKRDMLQGMSEEKVKELAKAMPLVEVRVKKTRPKKPFKQDGSYSATGAAWFKLLEENGLPLEYDGVVEVITGFKEPNPGSHDQIKAWLYNLGWQPTTFKYDRTPTGDLRKIPQVQQDKTKGGGLCPSVKKLFDKEPNLRILEGLSILTHRISVLNGFLDNVDEEGYVQAQVQGLTNTLRFKHKVVVNLPGVDKPYGADIRGCLVAPEGYELCGSDMSSLEDRTKQSFMLPYDPEYVKEMSTPGFDPHTALAVFAGEITAKEEDFFKRFDKLSEEEKEAASQADKELYKKVKAVRKIYKSVNYACVYGAGGPKVALTAGVPERKGYQLVEAYWKRNWSVKAIAEAQIVKVCNGMKWLFNPVSLLWYSLRHEKDRFSTLNQGTGVFCFDTYLKHTRHKGPPVVGQFHDEWITQVKKGHRPRMVKHAEDAIYKTNLELKLNRELGMGIQFGENYAQIH